MTATHYRTLTVAGSDSGGGAGIQADLKTFSALGCYGMTAITALTAQNTQEVAAIQDIPVDFLGQQIDAVVDDIGVDAVKIGMLHSVKVIKTVAEKLDQHQLKQVVLDPVMVATTGSQLLEDDGVEEIRKTLFPRARVVTPNLKEASLLLGRELKTRQDIEEGAREMGTWGPEGVVLKGGHGSGDESSDFLWRKDHPEGRWLDSPRVNTENTHGTGCTFSSAIAAYLARRYSLEEAVVEAKKYIFQAIVEGSKYQVGQGHGPVHHFWPWWSTSLSEEGTKNSIKFVDALVLRSPQLEKSVDFYRTLGLPLAKEQHDEGPVHFTCDLNRVHFSLYPTREGEDVRDDLVIGFEVEDLEEVVERARQWGSEIKIEPQTVPWGRRAMVLDPDCRKVELNRSTRRQSHG